VAGTEAYELLAVGVVLLALVVFASLHFLGSYRQRRLQALRGGDASPATANDRAFNRIALARREAHLLAAQGGEVERANQLIDLANRSLDQRQYDRAYELAQAAHETLVKARREPALRSNRSAAEPPATASTAPLSPSAPSSPAPATPAAPPMPKNRAEAQFELRLFEEDLNRAQAAGKESGSTLEARGLYGQAKAAFDRSEYAEAFRLSLRGRRRIGGSVESLGLPPVPAGAPPGPAGRGPTDPEQLAEQVASAERCPACGHPTVKGDTFCRGCGAAIAAASCPKCGTARRPQDTFCGKCGQRFA
jgi:Double zinc ribbon